MSDLPLPDTPRWVEAHDLTRAAASWRRQLGTGGACIGLTESVDPIVIVYGNPDDTSLRSLADEFPDHTLLLSHPIRDRICTRAILHTLPDPSTLPDYEGATPLPSDSDLTHLPIELQGELSEAEQVFTVYVDGMPVSFAYASSHSELYFDCAVDTAPGFRQLGLAPIVASTMIRAELAQGRDAVWGALEDNLASLALARRLGFVETDHLWVAAPVL